MSSVETKLPGVEGASNGNKEDDAKRSTIKLRIFSVSVLLALVLFDRHLKSFTWSEVFAVAAFVTGLLTGRRKWIWILYGIGLGALVGSLLDLPVFRR